jgi:RNA polymerase-interacting CarD/CdnL/TRCF family regulator
MKPLGPGLMKENRMLFKVDDQVVYPAFGVGRIVALVMKRFVEDENHQYYEVSGPRSTAWVAVADSGASGLRRLTRQAELADFRAVLRGRPTTLNTDHRQRLLDVRAQLKRGTLQAICETVRDLSARGWHKALSESDSHGLRQGRDALCAEWAAADGVTLFEATAEIDALLKEGRVSYATT